MRSKILAKLNGLRGCTSGNATMLVALSMPMLIGGGGLAVDTAQWYMWKREMQYAVDQAAIAGAWSKVNGSTGTDYQTRAQQELDANLQTVDFQEDADISLAKWQSTTNNSVLVTLDASKALPFSSMILSAAPTIHVSAQATYEKGRTFTSCLIAVDPSTSGAITIGGSAYVVANCGAAALSNSADAVIKNGNPTFNVGYIVSAGGIDDAFDGDTNLQIYENQKGLVDPFASLSPPAGNGISRTLSCTPAGYDYTVAYTETTTIKDLKYTSSSATGPWTLSTTTTISTASQPGSTTGTATSKKNDVLWNTSTVASGSVVSTPAQPAVPPSGCNKQGKNCTNPGSPAVAASYTRTDRETAKKAVVDSVGSKGKNVSAAALPGTYTDFRVSCDTTMAKGVYVIDGGTFKINAQDTVVGQGIMIVLKNGAGIEINGGSKLDLRAMTTNEMVTYGGISSAEALKLKDMLIFEDRNSSGASGNSVNGNAGAILDGTVYLPKSPISFNGTFGAVSRCLVITARTITIEGNANMTSFCPSGVTNTVSIGGGVTNVRLVA